MGLANEKRAIDALSNATDALLVAAWNLADAGMIDCARSANAAAKQANEECRAACDAILSRWWVKIIMRIGDWLTRKGAA